METVNRKNGIKYREMIWIDGQPLKSPCFARKTDAIKWKAEKISNQDITGTHSGFNQQNAKITLNEFTSKWLEEKRPYLTNKTYFSYEMRLRVHILPILGNLKMKDISLNHYNNLLNNLLNKKNAKSGINIILMVFKSIMKDARKKKIIQNNPLEGIAKLKTSDPVERYWSRLEVGQFLRANFNHPLYPLFLVAANTGMRLGELAGLCWDRIDFVSNLITITRSRDRFGLHEHTKTNTKRFVPMNPEVREILTILLKKQLNLKFVFAKDAGTPINVQHVYRHFHNAQKKAGFTEMLPFHGLRHTFSSQFMMSGKSIWDLQKILGHSSVKMTNRYAHFAPSHLQDAIKGFSLTATPEEFIGKNEANHNLTTEDNFNELNENGFENVVSLTN